MEISNETKVTQLKAGIIRSVLSCADKKTLEFLSHFVNAPFRNGIPVTKPSTEDLNHAIQAIESFKEKEEETRESLLK